ncbi:MULTISPECIES: hypothetical protein [Olivibacter]|uniref:Uncharacterized protein n=1 Tax=Olivibacter jilunii TaxID=985016 RepID=A0ABW6AYP0_9SPHI
MKKISIENLQYVKSPVSNGGWITKDKVYKLLNPVDPTRYGRITNDRGKLSLILLNDFCLHLNKVGEKTQHKWIPCDEHGEEVELFYKDGRNEFISGQYVDAINANGDITIEAFIPNIEDPQIRSTIAHIGNISSASGMELLNTAKLFAASKDLLECLEWLMSKVSDLNGDISMFGMAKCYEAIKKARGNFDNLSNKKPFE